MLKKILTISGKPGLFRLISQGHNALIVESLLNGRRQPTAPADRVMTLGDISIYTNEGETPLREVLGNIRDKYNAAKVNEAEITATGETLAAFFSEVLPDYDRSRVYPTDIKKVVKWYNLLIDNDITDFLLESELEEEAVEEEKTEGVS